MQLHSYVVHIKSDSAHLDQMYLKSHIRQSNGGVGGGGFRPFRGVLRVHGAHFRSALALFSLSYL